MLKKACGGKIREKNHQNHSMYSYSGNILFGTGLGQRRSVLYPKRKYGFAFTFGTAEDRVTEPIST